MAGITPTSPQYPRCFNIINSNKSKLYNTGILYAKYYNISAYIVYSQSFSKPFLQYKDNYKLNLCGIPQ